jgi:hypothetical protein
MEIPTYALSKVLLTAGLITTDGRYSEELQAGTRGSIPDRDKLFVICTVIRLVRLWDHTISYSVGN